MPANNPWHRMASATAGRHRYFFAARLQGLTRRIARGSKPELPVAIATLLPSCNTYYVHCLLCVLLPPCDAVRGYSSGGKITSLSPSSSQRQSVK